MTPVVKLTTKEAAELLSPPEKEGKRMDYRTFKKWARKLGFIEYEGTTPRKVLYSKEDIIKKWNQPKEESKTKKRRGKIF